MLKSYSIAEARDKFTSILREVERVSAIQLTRRGKPVAILLSIKEYRRREAGQKTFWNAYTAFRSKVDLAQLAIEPGTFADVRDSSPGRTVSW